MRLIAFGQRSEEARSLNLLALSKVSNDYIANRDRFIMIWFFLNAINFSLCF